MVTGRKVWSWYAQRRYTILFYSLVLTLLLGPLLLQLGLEQHNLEVFLAVNLLAAILPAGRTRAGRIALCVVVGLMVVVRAGTAWLGQDALSTLSLLFPALVALFAAASALGFALRGADISLEHIYAALGAYLLAGLVFGMFYWVLEQTWPGSLTFPGTLSRYDAAYFSFITLATVGYGDILPHSEVARALAIIEGIGGQLFLAVLVARLVSSYAGGKANR